MATKKYIIESKTKAKTGYEFASEEGTGLWGTKIVNKVKEFKSFSKKYYEVLEEEEPTYEYDGYMGI